MFKELLEYYRSNGISAQNFNCPYHSSCSQKHPTTFTTAKESFVSTGYVSHDIPRLVFVSLDSGGAEIDPSLKTLESTRAWEEEKEDILRLPKNKHWFRTHELAYTILRNFRNGLNLEDARHYFAHINSAKCCENKPGRAQANQKLFDNCRQFIPGELEILDPDIIITQGKWGKLSVEGAFPLTNVPDYVPEYLKEIRFVIINSHPVIWIETYHPRHGNFHKINKSHYSLYEKVIYAFIQDQSTFPIDSLIENRIMPINVDSTDKINKRLKTLRKKGNYVVTDNNGFITGYIELPEYPDYPEEDYPTKADCEGYTYITMVQLCNLTETHGLGRSFGCNAFGGDNGDIPVSPDRQAWKWYNPGHRRKKFVLVSAVEKYFNEIGIDW